MKEDGQIELLVQRYVQPYRNHSVLYRFTYYCDQTTSHKANFAEILGPKDERETKGLLDYQDDRYKLLCKRYTGLGEFEKNAKKVVQLMNRVLTPHQL